MERDDFEAMFRAHYDAVLSYALLRSDPHTAQDAAAETFSVAWRRLDEAPLQPRAWLLAVTRRTLADQYRSRERRVSLAQRLARLDLPSSGADPSETIAERSTIVTALDQLSAPDRELLLLIAWHGLTPDEAALVVGCSKKTAAVRLHRARRRLREHLTPENTIEIPHVFKEISC